MRAVPLRLRLRPLAYISNTLASARNFQPGPRVLKRTAAHFMGRLYMRKTGKTGVPSNVREAVLQGADIMAGFTTAEDRFTGPNTVVRHGQIESEDGLVISFIAKIEFGRPRR